MHPGRIQAGVHPPDADAQAVRANKLGLIERLADDLAHEIKNPLHSMVINLEVLKRRIGRPTGGEPEDLLRYVGILGGELDRVNRRIELLLRLVRPDRGGGAPTTLDVLVEEQLELLELERERRGISVRFEPASIPLRAHLPVDPARQLVLGLLVDAVERVPSRGALRVRTEVDAPWTRLRLDGFAPDGTAPAASERPRGEADGRLAVARDLARALGGRIEVAAAASPSTAPSPEPFVSLVLSLPLPASAP